MLPYAVAVVVGALIAGAEQANRLGARFTHRNYAWLWWLLRVLLDGAVGAAAVWLLHGVIRGFDNLLGWTVAGACGSAFVRLRILEWGRGDEARPVGIATAYEPVRALIEEQIDKRSAECQTEWINYTLLPALERAQTPPARLADFLIDYLKASRLGARKVDDEKTYIVRVRDGGETDKIKRERLVRHAVSLRAFRLLKRFQQLTEGEREPVR